MTFPKRYQKTFWFPHFLVRWIEVSMATMSLKPVWPKYCVFRVLISVFFIKLFFFWVFRINFGVVLTLTWVMQQQNQQNEWIEFAQSIVQSQSLSTYYNSEICIFHGNYFRGLRSLTLFSRANDHENWWRLPRVYLA